MGGRVDQCGTDFRFVFVEEPRLRPFERCLLIDIEIHQHNGVAVPCGLHCKALSQKALASATLVARKGDHLGDSTWRFRKITYDRPERWTFHTCRHAPLLAAKASLSLLLNRL